MEKLATGLVITAIAAALLFVGLLLSTLGGALAGWVVGWFFADTITRVFAQLGIHGFAMWQLGAFLGFVGAFFRTSVSKSE